MVGWVGFGLEGGEEGGKGEEEEGRGMVGERRGRGGGRGERGIEEPEGRDINRRIELSG